VGIGVAGTGLSGCGPALGLAANITDRASVRRMFDQVALAYGGFDSICVTAGIFVPTDTTGHIPDDKWALTFAINVTGSYIVGDEAIEDVEASRACAAASCSRPPPMRPWRRRARSPTTVRRRRPITLSAKWRSNLRRSCA
jgi:NAD(P)-dependent dehydrogenase (short-subunit alcohol dehydrogenase family)